MPASNLTSERQRLSRFDIVGSYAENAIRFVRHVGLFNSDIQMVKANDDVSAVHMQPPLIDKPMKAHVVGRVPLTNEDVQEIAAWIKGTTDEYERSKATDKRRQYIIDPPWQDVRDPNTGVRRYRRYSCAGFVLDSHLQVNIELLQLDSQALPEVDRETITSAYFGSGRHPRSLAMFGLQGDGPWRIVLPGYVLHALNRPSDQIRKQPYRAQRGNERF